ncbi:glycosyltransferase family 4 protein [Nocardioides litoris]|uniref:glycosyltransferase family 4 protein n=1 Tax=Nocardioides litoris TaxID=1926648 RepID=UPI00111E22AC|nr:glycosyltransferase family 4 protein [Nocardioides litoris]
MIGSVTHVVVTENFAGVERYVVTAANGTARAGWRVRVLGGDATAMRSHLDEGVEWSPAPCLRTAVTTLLRNPTDVVHAHMTKAEAASALAGRRSLVVATRHFAAPRGHSRTSAAVARQLARRVDREIAISDTVRAASGDPTMAVLLNPVPVSGPPRRPEPTVVVAQRWEAEKRTTDAVTAFERSALAGRGWRLLLHGSGTQEGELRTRVAASPCRAAIEVSGFARDMPRVLAAAGILFAPTPHEGFGLVVAEAMAAGVPVVASGSAGHLDNLGRVAPEWLYPAGDLDAAGRLLADLAATSPLAREALGDRLRSWVRDNLSVDAHVAGLTGIYAAGRRRS